jgi:hypothetical protein
MHAAFVPITRCGDGSAWIARDRDPHVAIRGAGRGARRGRYYWQLRAPCHSGDTRARTTAAAGGQRFCLAPPAAHAVSIALPAMSRARAWTAAALTDLTQAARPRLTAVIDPKMGDRVQLQLALSKRIAFGNQGEVTSTSS